MGIVKKDPANFNPSVEIPSKVNSFRFWCQKVLPLVYDDSLSYYELLCKVVDYLNNTIADVNTLGTDVDNLHKAFIQLQGYVNNYFSTLDVQEEVNKKLDDMAKDGTLTSLLWAKIGVIIPFYFGAKGDGVTDDTIALQKCFDYCENNPNHIIELGGLKYRITKTLNVGRIWNTTLQNGNLLADDDGMECILQFPKTDFDTPLPNTDITVVNNIKINNVVFDCNSKCGGINLYGFLKFYVNNCYFLNHKNYGFSTNRADAHEFTIDKCFFDDIAPLNSVAILINNSDNYVLNSIIKGGSIGIKITNSQHFNYIDNVHIYGITNRSEGIILDYGCSNNPINNMYMDGCSITCITNYGHLFKNLTFLEPKADLFTFNGNTVVDEIEISNCKIYTLNIEKDVKIFNIPNYNPLPTINNKIEITVQGKHVINNSYLLTVDKTINPYNIFNVDNTATKYELSQSGTVLLANPQVQYDIKIVNSQIIVNSFNNTGYHWYGFEITLEHDTDYLIQDSMLNNGGNLKIVGVAGDLSTQQSAAILCSNNVSQYYNRFNSGNYAHYLVIGYSTSSFPKILKIK